MSEPRNLAVARDLFTSGSGVEAERLVLHKLPLPFGSLGGWSLPAVAARLAPALKAEREEGAREEREAMVQHLRAFADISRRAGNVVAYDIAYGLAAAYEAGAHRKGGRDA